MLTVTPMAASAINAIVSSSPVPEGGLKISGGPTDDSQGTFQLSIAHAPDDTDSVVEEQGSRVFVEETAAPFLEDAVLDAQVDQGQVRFSLREAPDQP